MMSGVFMSCHKGGEREERAVRAVREKRERERKGRTDEDEEATATDRCI
jgi:hypothetical protein